MKTEPTQAKEWVRHRKGKYYFGKVVNIIEAEAGCDIAFREGQSSPKIKQLEWVETDEDRDGIKGIEAITPFGDYEIYENHDQTGYILWWFDPIPYVFNTQTEAKKFAEDDFEKRLKECLITE